MNHLIISTANLILTSTNAGMWAYKNGDFRLGLLLSLFMFIILSVWFGIWIWDKFFRKGR